MRENKLVPEIAERKSLTNWTHDKISHDTWELLLEAARTAPSSWNQQPARYVAVTHVANIQALCSVLHRTNAWAAHAAGIVVQVACPDDDNRVDGKDYYLYDCGLAMMSLVYQAQALGLTTRQMIGWDEAGVKAHLGIPERYRVVVMTGLGYPTASGFAARFAHVKRKVTSQDKRYALEHLLSFEQWGESKR